MPAERTDQTLTLSDGRTLGYAEYGAPDGTPGLYFHGHPGARFEPQLAHDGAAARGLRIIALDRPGYGRSSFQHRRKLLDWPNDVADVADQLSIDRFAVLGASGGGAYALACAYALPERVTRCGIVSGVAPYEGPGVTHGMRLQNRIAFKWGARIPPVARLIMRSMERQVRKDPQRVVAAVAKAMSGHDAAIATRSDLQQTLAEVIIEAFRQGSEGSAWDVVVLGSPWGFSVKDIRVRVSLWQGEDDTLVPPAMGHYLADNIPNSDAHFLANEGHLLIVEHMDEILDAFVGA